MSHESELKALTRRAYLSYHQDGLLDILVGWMAFCFGLYLLLDSAALAFFAWLPLLFYVPIKNALTIPRLGYAKFSGNYLQRNRTRLGLVLVVVLVLSVLVEALLLMAVKYDSVSLTSLRQNGMLIYGALITMLLLISGLLSGIVRLTAYGLLSAILATAGILASLPDYYLFIVLGLIIMLVGGILMISFTRKYPLSPKVVES